MFQIVNLTTEVSWFANKAEAKLYCTPEMYFAYSVFQVGGSGIPKQSRDL